MLAQKYAQPWAYMTSLNIPFSVPMLLLVDWLPDMAVLEGCIVLRTVIFYREFSEMNGDLMESLSVTGKFFHSTTSHN